MRLSGRLVAVVLAVAVLSPVGYANAESVDSGHQSVDIPPAASGPVVTQGNGSFDSSGIAAAASAASPQTGALGPTFTYTPIPDNLLITSAWPPAVQSGVIANP